MSILTPVNFDVQLQENLDKRLSQNTIADRDQIATPVRYWGMIVHVVDSDGFGVPNTYILSKGLNSQNIDDNLNWVAVATGSGGAFSSDSDTQITPSIPIVLDHAVNDEIGFSLPVTVNKAAGDATGFTVNVTNTASPGTLDIVDFQKDGATRFKVGETESYFAGNVATITTGRWRLLNEAPSATNPNILPVSSAVTTGIGGIANELSLITSGAEAINIDSSQVVSISPDIDGTHYISKLALGGGFGAADYAYISHFDQANSNNYGIRFSPAGATSLNAGSGASITFKINNTTVAFVESDGVRIRMANNKIFELGETASDPTGNNGQMIYNTTSNKIRVYENGAWTDMVGGIGGSPGGADTQIQFNDSGAFGGSANLTWNGTSLSVSPDIDSTHIIGKNKLWSLAADYATWSHFDHSSVTNYAIAQDSTGKTLINTPSGDNITFRVGNTTKWTLNSSGHLVGAANTYLALGSIADPDPAGANGILYYNSTNNKFRAYENGAWVDIIGGGGTPGGSDEQIQYNSSGAFAGSANLTYDQTQLAVSYEDATTDSVVELLKLQRTTSGTVADGIGASIGFYSEVTAGVGKIGEIIYHVSDVSASESSKVTLNVMDAVVGNMTQALGIDNELKTIEIGANALTNGWASSIAIGDNASIGTSVSGIAIGTDAVSDAATDNTITIGNSAKGYGRGGIYIGKFAGTTSGNAALNYPVVIGYSALGRTTNIGSQSVSIGYLSEASVSHGIAIGTNAVASGANSSIAAGQSAVASGASSIAIGPGTDATQTQAVAIGTNAQATTGRYSVAIGSEASVGAFYTVALGMKTSSTGQGSTTIGKYMQASAQGAMMLGYHDTAAQINSVTDTAEFNWDGNRGFKVGPLFGTQVTNSTDPDTLLTAAEAGSIAWDSTDNELRVYNGTTWAAVGGAGGTPAGSDEQIQFNNAGAFGASSDFTYDGTTVNISYEDATTNAVTEVLKLQRTTSGTVANGIGASVGFYSEVTAGAGKIGELIFDVTDVGSNEQAGFTINVMNGSVGNMQQVLGFDGDLRVVEIGHGASAAFNSSTAIGWSALVENTFSVAIGTSSYSKSSGVAIGYLASTGPGTSAVAIGKTAVISAGNGSVLIGNGTKAALDYIIAIGQQANSTSGTNGTRSTSIGFEANSGSHNVGAYSIGIGDNIHTTGNYSAAYGRYLETNAGGAIIMGYDDTAGTSINSSKDTFELTWNQIRGFKTGPLFGSQITNNADPSTNLTLAESGSLAWDTTSSELQIYNGSAFNNVMLGGGAEAGATWGIFGTTPVVQQTTTSQTAATFSAGTSGISDDTATWNGYTIGDLVAILQAYGILT
jgi:hypothetical protein